MAVRIGVRIAKFRGNPVFEALRNEMLEAFGFLVHFIPMIAENIVQESLEQAVMAQDFQRAELAGVRQAHAMMLFIFHKWRPQ